MFNLAFVVSLALGGVEDDVFAGKIRLEDAIDLSGDRQAALRHLTISSTRYWLLPDAASGHKAARRWADGWRRREPVKGAC